MCRAFVARRASLLDMKLYCFPSGALITMEPRCDILYRSGRRERMQASPTAVAWLVPLILKSWRREASFRLLFVRLANRLTRLLRATASFAWLLSAVRMKFAVLIYVLSSDLVIR